MANNEGERSLYPTDEELREFIALWKEEFGETLTLEQAEAIAKQLLELYWRLSQNPGQGDKKSS